MTSYTTEQIEAVGGRGWTHPRSGERRIYLNDWPTWAGFDIDYYKTGNVRSASLDGAPVSNTRTSRMLTARVYWVVTDGPVDGPGRGELHTDLAAVADAVRLPLSGAELVRRVRAGLAAAVAALPTQQPAQQT